jgi:hypothetical protein
MFKKLVLVNNRTGEKFNNGYQIDYLVRKKVMKYDVNYYRSILRATTCRINADLARV